MKQFFERWLGGGLLAGIVASSLPLRGEEGHFKWTDGDRVVLVGGTFIERAQAYGHLETFFTARWPERSVIFRNLGWSGDTVFCEARSYFGPPEEGFERLIKLLTELKPTVILSAYGAVEAFEGEAGLSTFVDGYKRLLEAMDASTDARFVLLSPPPLENLAPPLPNQDLQNRRVALYRDAIASLAAERGAGFADVFAALGGGEWANYRPPLTGNGLHFTSDGYRRATRLIAQALGIPPASFEVEMDGSALAAGKRPGAEAGETSGVVDKFEFPLCPPSLLAAQGTLRVTGLPSGRYSLRVDDNVILTASAKAWEHGLKISLPCEDRLERLREAVVAKNELFFHRWRPQNETYLFGFRKHEQGNNAVEVAQFDALIAEAEASIAELRQPTMFHLTLAPCIP